MKIIILFLGALLPSILIAQTKVDYTVFYSANSVDDGLKVELKYKTKKSQDSIYFHDYNDGCRENNLFNCLELLQSENPTLTFDLVPDSNRIIVHYLLEAITACIILNIIRNPLYLPSGEIGWQIMKMMRKW
jgi:hypothetical protein